jgi:hypothetical protein
MGPRWARSPRKIAGAKDDESSRRVSFDLDGRSTQPE